MVRTLSEVLGVSAKAVSRTGAFDCFVGVDARLHIDPHLLASSAAPELHDARPRFEAHFEGVLKLLLAANRPTQADPLFAKAIRSLTFREIPHTGLGYAKGTKRGTAIGHGLATRMAELGKVIVDAGVIDPDIFALMGLLQDGIGADRISDMTAAVTLQCFLEFSQRVALELRLPTRATPYGDRVYRLPLIERSRETIVLVPRDVLRHLPVAEDWSDIDIVASHNATLRARVNQIIGETWRRAVRLSKRRLRETVLRYPELLHELVAKYKAKPAAPYDLESDPESLYQWHPITRAAVDEAPLALRIEPPASYERIVEVVRLILGEFKRMVEANRLGRLLYNDDGTPRREKASHWALYGVADAYCRANNLDLSPETDSGSGPVDFKFSQGYYGRVVAEVKLSSSSRLRHGLEEQVNAYAEAEQAYHAFYLIMRVDDTEKPINDLRQRVAELRAAGIPCPELIVIDARPQDPASVRRGGPA